MCRAATNSVILHPNTGKNVTTREIAYFETVILTFAWCATLVGMAACGLGYESKTGWAVFSFGVFSVTGYAACYALQRNQDKSDALQKLEMC